MSNMKQYLPPIILLIFFYYIMDVELIVLEKLLGEPPKGTSLLALNTWGRLGYSFICIFEVSIVLTLIYTFILRIENNSLYILCGVASALSIPANQLIKWLDISRVTESWISYPGYKIVLYTTIVFTPLLVSKIHGWMIDRQKWHAHAKSSF